jgi:16S rRNA (guanine527-N7)-methyltransferase
VKRGDGPEARLDAGLQALGLAPALGAPLMAYLAELQKWNAAYNLTAVRDPAQMVTRHLLDSLAILSTLDDLRITRLLDVGSGAGLPGIVVALARPDMQVALLDSNGKKARFLRHAVRTLSLGNAEVFETRVESHAPAQGYDGIVSRAFASLGDFIALTQGVLMPGGHWLAMKGRLDHNEMAALPLIASTPRPLRLQIPGLREERHLVVASRLAP